MKSNSLLWFTALLCAYSYTFGSPPTLIHKLELKGKVGAINSTKAVQAKITIQANGVDFIIATDFGGFFSADIPQVSSFTLLVESLGFEIEEKEITVPPSDSIVNISVALTPKEKMKLQGTIRDKKTRQPVAAEFDLYMDNDMIKEDVEIVNDGKYVETMLNYGWYIIDITARGYLNLTDTIWVLNCKRPEMHRDYYMTPIETGLTVVLKSIQFKFGTTDLHPDSNDELDGIVKMMKEYPNMKLEIAGHTDSDGPEDFNLILSQGRAQSVVDYLTNQGTELSRLTAKGYGESKPIDTRDTPYAKFINRRVEFTVLQN
ncbi:hypothetical protein WSM22_00600 [Cytophagales bacterium WSM2-2]|nr:hypothetical protein WSM22_00600 [Cytophagales bacterium WSM2-2]